MGLILDGLRFYHHAQQLQIDHNVKFRIEVSARMLLQKGRANKPSRTVFMPCPVVGEDTYLTFTHEMGHIVSPKQHWNNDRYLMLADEHDAWKWARDHAIIWTVGMQREAIHSLYSYYEALYDIKDPNISPDFDLDPRVVEIHNYTKQLWNRSYPKISF